MFVLLRLVLELKILLCFDAMLDSLCVDNALYYYNKDLLKFALLALPNGAYLPPPF